MNTVLSRRDFVSLSAAVAAGGATAYSVMDRSLLAAASAASATPDAESLPFHRSDLTQIPVIDFHTHLKDTVLNATTEGLDAEVAAQVELKDDLNIRKTIVLCLGKPSRRLAFEYLTRAPEKYVVYMDLDFANKNEPGWSASMVRHVEESVRRGATGLKFWLGPRGQEVAMPMDDPRLDPVYGKAGELGLPIAHHCNDPEEFYYPPNRFNFWCGADHIKEKGFSHRLHELVSREEIVRQLRNMIARHPQTTFILVHMAFLSRQLALLADILERHPNVRLDLSAAVEELGRSPKESAAFLTNFSGRILFGTDGNNTTPWKSFLHRHFIALETNLDDIQGPYKRAWTIQGMNLPKDALERIYYKNAEELLAQPIKIPPKD